MGVLRFASATMVFAVVLTESFAQTPDQLQQFTSLTPAQREANGDPRPSIEERYPSKDKYLARVRAAGEALAAERYLMEEDIDVSVAQASKFWAWLT